MTEIKCPICNTVISLDDNTYAKILAQVKDNEFERELTKQIQQNNQLNEQKLQLVLAKQETKHNDALAAKDAEITRLHAEICVSDNTKRLAVAEAEKAKDADIAKLTAQINKLTSTTVANAKAHNQEIHALKIQHEKELEAKDETIKFYKEFKARQSTKTIGESLEKHCSNKFNAIRAIAFPNSYFEKDNTVSATSSKGDFILRDFTDDGVEYISVMFEMKNEADETLYRHKNEDFFKELDKDRTEKKCEYAVLVSMLEPENELYNEGIVDVSHRYPKMFVVRPQFFIPLIGLLRNAALNTIQYKKEILELRDRQADISHLSDNIEAFKQSFAKNCKTACVKFDNAIHEIDKSIASLQKTKDYLLSSAKHLSLAEAKTDKITFAELTKEIPTITTTVENK